MNQADGERNKSTATNLTRRGFLAGVGAAGLAASMGIPGARTARASVSAAARGPAKNLIFLCSDGMSFGTLTLADLLIQSRHGRRSHWMQLIDRTRDKSSGVSRALLDTRSANALVTDSGAAACAWGCGELFDNGAMGHTPDGRTPVPIMPHAKQSGKFVGVATTTRVTHATPAGFCCNVPGGRNAEHDIADQMIERGIDLILGGGRSRFRDMDAVRSRGYHAMTARDELLALTGRPATHPRVLGLFSDSHMAYDIDRQNDPEINRLQPTLAEMTDAAIRIAHASDAGSNYGFLIQIEGGRVDHAAHSNDAVALIHDQAAFDDAVRVALDFASSRDDTLVIVTTDHGNANPGLTDYTSRGIEGFENLVAGGKRSMEWAFEQLGRAPSVERIEEILRAATGIELTRDELLLVNRWLGGAKPHPFELGNANGGPVGAVLANHTKVAFLSPNHTSDAVEVTTIGAGAARYTGVMTMPDMHAAMVESLGLPPARPLA